MRRSTRIRTGSTALILALAFATTACGSDSGTAPDPGQSGSEAAPEEVLDVLEDALAGPDAEGNDGRAFDSTDDAVIYAVERTFQNKNAKAEWAGSTLRVGMDGSVDEPTASIPCLALEALLADGEDAVIVFSDGDLICADRFNTD